MKMAPQLGPRNLVYEDPFRKIFRQDADFSSFSKTYFVCEAGARVGVVAPRNGNILLVRQYRLLLGDLSWEIPGGAVAAGETPEQAAVRECAEEAGVACRELVPLVRYFPGMDAYLNPTYVYQAVGFDKLGSFRPDGREVVERAWVPLADCLDMIRKAEMICALSVIGVLAYADKMAVGRQ